MSYSLINRKIELNGILDTAKELGITIIAWGPLLSGVLTGKFHQNPELLRNVPLGRRISIRRKINTSQTLINELREIAHTHAATISQIALN